MLNATTVATTAAGEVLPTVAMTNETYVTPYSVPTTVTILLFSLSASIITAIGNALVIASFYMYRPVCCTLLHSLSELVK